MLFSPVLQRSISISEESEFSQETASSHERSAEGPFLQDPLKQVQMEELQISEEKQKELEAFFVLRTLCA